MILSETGGYSDSLNVLQKCKGLMVTEAIKKKNSKGGEITLPVFKT